MYDIIVIPKIFRRKDITLTRNRVIRICIAMKTLLYANRAEPKSISMISILLLAAAGDITKLR